MKDVVVRVRGWFVSLDAPEPKIFWKWDIVFVLYIVAVVVTILYCCPE